MELNIVRVLLIGIIFSLKEINVLVGTPSTHEFSIWDVSYTEV